MLIILVSINEMNGVGVNKRLASHYKLLCGCYILSVSTITHAA